MKHAAILGIMTVVILALLIAIKVFAYVFIGMLYYGMFAFVIAVVFYVWWLSKRKKKNKI